MITSIKKRDGREIHFSPEKITRAIFLAASRVAQEEGSKADYETAEILTEKVVNLLNNTYQGTTPTVENVQDAVIKVLIETGHAKTSEAYILYRAERTRIRSMKTRLMKSIEEITFADSMMRISNVRMPISTVIQLWELCCSTVVRYPRNSV